MPANPLPWILCAVLTCSAVPSRAEEPVEAPPEKDPLEDAGSVEGLPERIDEAIERGVAWLRKAQKANGSWWESPPGTGRTYEGQGRVYRFPAGSTSMALYTLLKCGASPDDPAVRRGFDWLRKAHRVPGTAYESSMSLLAVTATADPHKRLKDSAAPERRRLTKDWRKWAMELKDDLLRRQAPRGWRYYGKGGGVRGGDEDLSSTQLAALALLAADRAGIQVPTEVWVRAMAHALAQQEPDGPEHARSVVPRGPGWDGPGAAETRKAPPGPDRARGFSYIREGADLVAHESEAGGSMTACGVGTLLVGRYVLLGRRGPASKDAVAKAYDLAPVEQAIFDGMAWLDENWSPFHNPPRHRRPVCYLYCVERAMDFMGCARVGEHSWYVEMAEALLGRQEEEGRWNVGGSWDDHESVYDTCFALLFLSRATRDVPGVPVLTGEGD